MTKTLVLVACAVALLGCTTSADRLARHQSLCTSFGLQKDTPAFADCLIRLETADHARGGLLNSGTK